MRCPQQTNSQRQKVSKYFPRARGELRENEAWLQYRLSFWGDENVLQLIAVMAVQLCDYTNNQDSARLTQVKRTVYELYGNEALTKTEGRETEEITINFLEWKEKADNLTEASSAHGPYQRSPASLAGISHHHAPSPSLTPTPNLFLPQWSFQKSFRSVCYFNSSSQLRCQPTRAVTILKNTKDFQVPPWATEPEPGPGLLGPRITPLPWPAHSRSSLHSERH